MLRAHRPILVGPREAPCRKPTAYRNRTPGKRVSDLEPYELLHTDDPAVHQQAVRAVADYVPYDPSVEMPDEGMTNGRLKKAFNPTEARSSKASCSACPTG